MQDINLLPQSEISQQSKVKAVKLSTILSIIFLVLVIAASGYVLYLNSKVKAQIAGLDSEIQGFRNEITARADVEVTVRNLDKKYNSLKDIFSKQTKYSKLMEELRSRKPETLNFESLDVKEGRVNLNGIADNYVSIAGFVNNLLDKKFSGGAKGLEELFTAVSLNSVNMENSKNKIQFFLVVDFNEQLLK
jgi:Tfp pilus assembly protein PilN